jgi:Ca2+-binding RTX toxin-like protein
MSFFDDFSGDIFTLGSIDVGGFSTGVIEHFGDRDWFRIALSAGGSYRFNLNNGDTLTDPFLSVRDASGAVLASNDDSFFSLNSEIFFTAPTSGTYFLEAGAFSDAFAGSYTLSSTTQGFVGTIGNDVFVGGIGDDFFSASRANDSYDGLSGIDTINYSSLGQRVTLKSQGVIEKAGGFGTDTIAGVERIIGALGKSNVIDGTVAGPQTTSFNINLATNNLTVNGIPGIGSASFFIENFTDVRGTSNSDIVVGDGARNGFFGTDGSDSYDGLGGFDTIDYGALGTAVTLKSQGIIEKGPFGTDTIAGMERIIGAAGQINLIDGFTGGPQPTSFEIDLDGSLLLVKNIPFIGDQAFFIKNFVNVRGTSNDDFITGSSLPGIQGDNTFFGSSGNDSYDGAGGIDTIDYSSLGQRVTLKSQGVIEKDGAFGTDTIAGVERIIGTFGFVNVIDGTVAGPQTTSFDINLATNNLTVNGIPGIGSTSFFIQNFTDVRGTSNSDTVVGDDSFSFFFGSAGNDSYDGGGGLDRIDYSGLGQSITLKSQGVIEKAGGLGTDTIAGIEQIIGDVGQSNLIDGTVAGPQVTSFDINLATNNLTVNGIPGIGSASFFVQNFTDVLGTINSDTVVGDALANTLNTGAGNDTLSGGAGNDTLIGGAGNDSYSFDTDLALGNDTLNEAGGGVDTLNFSATTALSVTVNLGLATNQVVNTTNRITLGSVSTFENVIGGSLADTLTGNNLANSFKGGGGNDTLNTGAGNDTLSGGAGNDILIGGTGADRFRFDAPLNAATNRDIVSDFSIAQGDRFELENSVFTALTTTGTLAANAFFIGAAATTATQRILYNSAAGSLLYDRDGIGGFGSIAFATITSGLALTNTSFTIT